MEKEYLLKWHDYKRFGYVLLAVSSFLFLGLIVPTEQQASAPLFVIILDVILLSTAFVCFHIAMKNQKKYYEELEN